MGEGIVPTGTWLYAAILLTARLGAALVATPVLGGAGVPVRIRVLWVLAMSALLSSASQAHAMVSPPPGVGGVALALLSEVTVGLTLGLGIILAFAAFGLAGRLVSVQIGLGLGQALDPTSGLPEPALSSAMRQIGLLVFFLAGGHHGLLRGLARSVEHLPLGRAWALDGAIEPVLRMVTSMVSLGFAIAAPVVFALFLLDVALGAMARGLPQLNMLVLGIPLKAVAGLLALSLWSSSASVTMARVYGSIYGYWEELFAARHAPATHGALLAVRSPGGAARRPPEGTL